MISTDADTTICAGDLVAFTGTGGDTTSLYQYRLNGTNVTSLTLDSTYSNALLANNDVITLFSQTSEGCTDSSFMTFNVDALPTTSLTSTELGTIICQNTNVTFTASGATTYEFFVNGISQGAASATTTFSTSILTAVDVVTVIGHFANGCSFQAPQSFTYSIIATPVITMTSSDIDFIICGGDNVSFSVSGGVTYEFFIDGVSQGAASPVSTLSTTGLTDGQTVSVVGDLAGCEGTSAGMLFTVITSPTTALASSDVDDIICQGESVTFTGGGATNYEFFIDGITQGPSSPTNVFTTSTLINGQTISINGESNGCIIQDQLTYTVLPTPAISLFSDDADNIICDAEPITFTTANAAFYQLYVNGAVFGGTQPSATFVNPALAVGTNLVYVEGTSLNGCSSNSLPEISVTVNPIPIVVNTSSDADDIICQGDLVTFTGSGSDLYQFFIDGIAQTTLSSTSTFSTTSLTDGQNIEILGSSLGCTSNSNVINMTVNTVPVVSLTNTDPNNIWCSDEVVTFNAFGAPNFEFIVDGVSQGASSPMSTINSATFAVGSYTVEVIGEQANCFGSASMGIVINPLPVPTLVSSDADDIICEGESVTYTAGGGGTYEFFIDGVSQGITSGINTFTSTTFVNGNVVSVIVTSGGGCTESTVGNVMTVNPAPVVTLASSDVDFIICVGENVTFTGGGASDFEFFLNGVSQGPSSATTTFTTSTLANGDIVGVTGSLLGCTNSPASLTFTVFNFPVVSLVNNAEIQICTGELTDLSASGATNYQFLVNGVPTGPSSAATTLNTALINGDVVTVIGELNGCPTTSTDSYTFTVFDFPALTSTSSDVDNIICLDELISFTGSGAMTYDFALNGTVLQSGAGSTFDISTLLDGDIISITGFNGDCPSVPDTYLFTVNSMTLALVASPSNMICEGDAVTFTASGGDNYEFFLNGASTGPMSATSTYTSSTLNHLDEVTFIANNVTTVCTQALGDYILMNVVDEPSITALSAIEFCDGDSVILVSGVAYGNQWYLDGVIIPGATDTSYVAHTSGVYSLETTSGGVGAVWSFGQNASGTIGNGENLNSADPAVSVSTEVFDELSTGYDFILGVTTAGDLHAWGDNTSGQLGDGTYTSTNIPQAVPTLTGIKTAATSESSVMAVSNTGDVYVWGNNSQGQLGTGNTSVINFPLLNAAIANTDSIAGGRDHFVILRNDGTVWVVGNNDFGQLGQGDLVASSNPLQVSGLTNIVSVGAGEYQSFAIDNNGALYVWGNNGSGQLGLGDLNNRLDPALSGLQNIINAQGGASHSAFLSSNNKVFTTGANGFGQLGSTNFVDATLPIEVDVTGATMISTGQYTTLIKRLDKSVFGFGNNTEDQLSSVTGLTVPTPEYIHGLDGVEFIEAGRITSHVIYNEDQTCLSAGTTVNTLTAPTVTITVDADTLTATAGVTYQWYLDGSVIPGATNQTYVVTATGDYYVDVTFASGCVGTSPAQPHSGVGIDDLTFGTVSLYPNPAKNQVNLTFSSDVLDNTSYMITDQAGRVVLNGEIMNSNMTLDINELENGMYNLILTNDYATRSLRFVKSLK
jgi:alpha-tubulin suppressor-like RCC1 family protein